MKRIFAFLVVLLFIHAGLKGQVSISSDGTPPDASAMLDVQSSSRGFLPPRLTTAQRDSITGPATGLMIFNTDCQDVQIYNGANWIPFQRTGVLPAPGAITGPTELCEFATGVNYSTASVPGAVAYHWIVPAGSLIAAGQGTTAITVDFAATGGIVGVSTSDDCNRSPFSTIAVELVPAPAAMPVLSVRVNPPAECSADSVNYEAVVGNPPPDPHYQWSENGITVAGATDANYFTSAASRVDCDVTSENPCIQPATGNLQPGTAGSGNPICYGEPITLFCGFLTAGCGMPSASYHWENSSGSWTSGLQNPVILQGETGYNSDIFYLTLSNALPGGGVLKSWTCVVVEPCSCPGIPTVSYGGQVYNTVQIGMQCWLKENLNIGNMIPGIQNQTNNLVIEKYCYKDSAINCDIYGGLYQWTEMMNYAVTSNSNPSGRQGICPPGWHLPSDAEICQMEIFLDPTVDCEILGWRGTDISAKLRETGYAHWMAPNVGATNASGFTCLPGGLRNTGGAVMSDRGSTGFIWTTRESDSSGAWRRYIHTSYLSVYRNYGVKTDGMSARCLKD